MSRITIEIPIRDDGTFDVETQQKIATYFVEYQQRKDRLKKVKLRVEDFVEGYLGNF